MKSRRGALLLAVLVALAAAYSTYVTIRATVEAIGGAGDPEVIWPAIAILVLATAWLTRTAHRLYRRATS